MFNLSKIKPNENAKPLLTIDGEDLYFVFTETKEQKEIHKMLLEMPLKEVLNILNKKDAV